MRPNANIPKIKKGLKGKQGLPRATALSRKLKPTTKASRSTSIGRETSDNKPPRKRYYYETSADNTRSLFVDSFDPTDDDRDIEAPTPFVSLRTLESRQDILTYYRLLTLTT